jgi:hypothetical protein
LGIKSRAEITSTTRFRAITNQAPEFQPPQKRKKKKKKKTTRERVGGRGNIEREGPAGDKKKQRDPILNRISPNEEEEAASRRTTDLVAGPFYRAF